MHSLEKKKKKTEPVEEVKKSLAFKPDIPPILIAPVHHVASQTPCFAKFPIWSI